MLVVDDDPDIAYLVASRIELANDGWIAPVAHSGEEALALLDETDPDVIVLDFRMPERNGIEVADDILRRRPEANVVLFSAYLDAETVDAAQRLGVRECVSKEYLHDLPTILGKYCPEPLH